MIEFLPAATFIVALVAATFAVLSLIFILRSRAPLESIDVSELLRFEGDSIKAAADSNTRALRLEIVQTLSQNQNAALDTIFKLSDQLLKQVGAFGVRLEASNKITESRIGGIGTKLNSDIEQMGKTANSNRETLRGLIEQKLEFVGVSPHGCRAQSQGRAQRELSAHATRNF